MLKVAERVLPPEVDALLAQLQSAIDLLPSYPEKVEAAAAAWASKMSSKPKQHAFTVVRRVLAEMCVGPVRCAYCEDSLADEIEHILPKNLFPSKTFEWRNYLFACGPCNGPKSNRFGILSGASVEEFTRARGDLMTPPPAGISALVNPREDDPLDFFELDLGGIGQNGAQVEGTFLLISNVDAAPEVQARADFTIDLLGLNREVMRVARRNAFGGFRARLREYVSERQTGFNDRLEALRVDILRTPHLTVFAEMRRQKMYLPEIRDLLELAPEAETWALVPQPS